MVGAFFSFHPLPPADLPSWPYCRLESSAHDSNFNCTRIQMCRQLKVRIPQNNHKVNQHATICNDPLYGCGAQFRRLWWSCCEKFGQASGRAIMQKIICEFGGQRISFPDHMDIFRWERNEAILIQRQNGVAPKELGLRWGLCHHRILEILKD